MFSSLLGFLDFCWDFRTLVGISELWSGFPNFGQDFRTLILEHNATDHNYKFIDNSNITPKHLRRDELHLNKDGEILLARNFLNALNALNARGIYDDFF